MGFGWGTGGLSVPFVGMIADRIGIQPTLSGLALVPLIAAACAIPLPSRAVALQTPPRGAELLPEATDTTDVRPLPVGRGEGGD